MAAPSGPSGPYGRLPRRPNLRAVGDSFAPNPAGQIPQERGTIVTLLQTRFTGRGQAAAGIGHRLLLHAFVLTMVIAVATATLLK